MNAMQKHRWVANLFAGVLGIAALYVLYVVFAAEWPIVRVEIIKW